MSKRKPLSAEEKRVKLLELLQERGEVFQLKDLERIAPTEKGIVMQSVKTTLMDLVDNGDVRSEKIAGSIFFWSFPTDAVLAAKAKLLDIENQIAIMQKKIDSALKQLEDFDASSQESTKAVELEATIEALKKEKDDLEKRLEASKGNMNCDDIAGMENETKPILDAANRWTDNIFAIRSWCKRKFCKEDRDLNKAFGISDDLDYIA